MEKTNEEYNEEQADSQREKTANRRAKSNNDKFNPDRLIKRDPHV